MRGPRTASIVITNYDYGGFLSDAIESALLQSWPDTEVIVVDDGSRDRSRDVIARYDGRVTAVLKENGGQASAFNTGFARCRGDAVLFLDADDVLLPDAVERAIVLLTDPRVVKVHWPLEVITADGRPTGERYPDAPLAEGDRRRAVLRTGPTTELSPPTSGNLWARRFLERVLPMPEALYRISADKYLMEVAPFFGEIRALDEPVSRYRRHGRNSQVQADLGVRLNRELRFYDHYTEVIRAHLARRGITPDLEAWKSSSWWHRQQQALREIAALPAARGPLVFVDDGAWGTGTVAGRERLPFLERNGRYWGQPPDDATAIRELERLRGAGTAQGRCASGRLPTAAEGDDGPSYVVFVWSTFWWLDHYPGFHRYLRVNFPCVLENERLVVFDLRTPSGEPAAYLAGAAATAPRLTHW